MPGTSQETLISTALLFVNLLCKKNHGHENSIFPFGSSLLTFTTDFTIKVLKQSEAFLTLFSRMVEPHTKFIKGFVLIQATEINTYELN